MINKKLWPFYLYYFFMGLHDIIAPMLWIFFVDKGMSFSQVSILLAASFLAGALSEIPTGAFADLYGRKKSVVLGLILDAIFIVAAIYTKSFIILLLLFIYWGFGYTFISGADEAWLIDSIPKNESKEKIIGRRNSIRSAGIFIAGILASLCIQIFGNTSSTWYARFIISIITILILIIFTRDKKPQLPVKKINISNEYKNMWTQSSKGLKHILQTKNLLMLSFAIIFFIIAQEILDAAHQSFYRAMLVPTQYWGYVFSIAAVVGIILPLCAEKLLKIFKHEKYFLIGAVTINMIVFALVYFVTGPIGAMSIIFLSSVFIRVREPIETTYMHKHIPSKIRATSGSAMSMFINLSAAIGLVIGGVFTDALGGKYAIFSLAFFMLIVMYFYFKLE